MPLSLEQIRTFQKEELESHNNPPEKSGPNKDHVVEWALVELVILLTEIKSKLP